MNFKIRVGIFIILMTFLYVFPESLNAANFYVDSVNGSENGDGSAERPWNNLQKVLDSNIQTRFWRSLPYKKGHSQLVYKNLEDIPSNERVRSGDTIIVKKGRYGHIKIRNSYNRKLIYLQAEEGVYADFIDISASSKWEISGFNVTPQRPSNYRHTNIQALVLVTDHEYNGPSYKINIRNLTVASAGGTSHWGAGEWNNYAYDGISIRSKNIRVWNNIIHDVKTGILLRNEYIWAQKNRIHRFAEDGIRAHASHVVIEYNDIRRPLAVNQNHDDGIQLWSLDASGTRSGQGLIKDVAIRGNRIEQGSQAGNNFHSYFQGIGCFDGFYESFYVENNVVIADSWHGISFLGMLNSRIVNNTIISSTPNGKFQPMLKVQAHKSRGLSQNVTIRNNIVSKLDVAANLKPSHNTIFKDATSLFLNLGTYDLRLSENSEARNAGSNSIAPSRDIDGIRRPQYGVVDHGAYEYPSGGYDSSSGASNSLTIDAEDDFEWVADTDSDINIQKSLSPKSTSSGQGPLFLEGGCSCSSSANGQSGPIFLLLGLLFSGARKRRLLDCVRDS